MNPEFRKITDAPSKPTAFVFKYSINVINICPFDIVRGMYTNYTYASYLRLLLLQFSRAFFFHQIKIHKKKHETKVESFESVETRKSNRHDDDDTNNREVRVYQVK